MLLYKELHGGGLSHEKREPLIRWVLLDRALINVHFVRHESIFGQNNNFCMRVRAKFGLYCGCADFSNVYQLQLSKGVSFWLRQCG